MPYLEGETLADRIAREGALPVDEALGIVGELAGALDCAHRHGIIHRDVKPTNVILTEGGAVLMDVERGSSVRVGGDGYGGQEVVWLSSGEILYQMSGDRSYGLIEPDRGEVGELSAPEGVWLYGPRGSPDGSRVAFRGTGERPGLWVAMVGEERWVRVTERALGPVAWAEEGDTIYAMPAQSRGDDWSRDVFAIPLDGGKPRLAFRLPDGLAMSPWNVSMSAREGLLVGVAADVSVDVWVLEDFDPR